MNKFDIMYNTPYKVTLDFGFILQSVLTLSGPILTFQPICIRKLKHLSQYPTN